MIRGYADLRDVERGDRNNRGISGSPNSDPEPKFLATLFPELRFYSVTYAFVFLTMIVYAVRLLTGGFQGGISPVSGKLVLDRFNLWESWRFFTYVFCNFQVISWMPSCFFLLIIAPRVESLCGSLKFGLILLGCTLGGALMTLAFNSVAYGPSAILFGVIGCRIVHNFYRWHLGQQYQIIFLFDMFIILIVASSFITAREGSMDILGGAIAGISLSLLFPPFSEEELPTWSKWGKLFGAAGCAGLAALIPYLAWQYFK